MTELQGFPYFEVRFTKDGPAVDPTDVDALVAFLTGAGAGVTDLFVMSHGWLNDVPDARSLYDRFFAQVRAELNAGRVPLAGRAWAVLGVLWPSMRSADPALIPGGGAAALAAPFSGTDVEALIDGLDDLIGGDADADLQRAKALVPQLDASADARREFADLIRGTQDRGAANDEDASARFFDLDGEDLMQRLSRPMLFLEPPVPGDGQGGAADVREGAEVGDRGAGGALGLGSFFSNMVGGVVSAARKLLNFATYYQMKHRSGVVGERGLNPALATITAARPDLRIHLIGHSFGARLVTAATTGPADGSSPGHPATLTLLQAAFSHYAFAHEYDGAHDGLFRTVVSAPLVGGAMLVTYTKNDLAVGLAYPIASQIAGQIAAAIGDAGDPYGGLGRNGTQKTTESTFGTLGPVTTAYVFEPHAFLDLNADDVIKNHSDIAHAEVAHALLSLVSTT